MPSKLRSVFTPVSVRQSSRRFGRLKSRLGQRDGAGSVLFFSNVGGVRQRLFSTSVTTSTTTAHVARPELPKDSQGCELTTAALASGLLAAFDMRLDRRDSRRPRKHKRISRLFCAPLSSVSIASFATPEEAEEFEVDKPF